MSKTTIQMQRRGQRLECVSPAWADLLEEIPQGVDLNVAITRARSLKQNGTYWGTLAWLITDGPEQFGRTWLSKDELSDALQLEVGFVPHPRIAMAGASPDGLVGADGLVEIKAPNSSTHLETLRSENIKGAYLSQMQWQMACTGRMWCDFVSYDPRFPESMALFIKRVHRDQEIISGLEAEVIVFLKEVDDAVVELGQKYGGLNAEAA